MHASVSINHLSRAKVSRHRQERDRFLVTHALSRHQKVAQLVERIAH